MTVEQQAMPKPGVSPEADSAGALQGGEAHHGDPQSVPRPLGRKDPTMSEPGADKTSQFDRT